jgi:alpha-tubulin suppressor-like RCC1 family protein
LGDDGRVYVKGSGSNVLAQGNSTELYNLSPILTALNTPLENVTQLVPIDDSSPYTADGQIYVIDSTGDLWSAGYNNHGQLGHGIITSTNFMKKVINIGGTSTGFPVVKVWVSNHGSHTACIALDSNLKTWAWGSNLSQQRFGTLLPKGINSTPIEITSLMLGSYPIKVNASQHDNGPGHFGANTYILLNSGKIVTCGLNSDGQLCQGHGNTTTQLTFLQENLLATNWRYIRRYSAQGVNGLFAINNLNQLFYVGKNQNNHVGSTYVNNNSLQRIDYGKDFENIVAKVFCGGVSQVTTTGTVYGSTIVLTTNGKIFVCGYRPHSLPFTGSVATDQYNEFIEYPLPVGISAVDITLDYCKLINGDNFVAGFCVVVLSNGKMLGWGSSESLPIGYNDRVNCSFAKILPEFNL